MVSMRAVELLGARRIRVVDVPRPVIGAREILVKVRAAAICGTDVRMFMNGYDGVDEAHPLTLGHEIAGVIAQVGSKVTRCPTA